MRSEAITTTPAEARAKNKESRKFDDPDPNNTDLVVAAGENLPFFPFLSDL